MTRPDCLRETPWLDRSDIGMRWSNQWTFQAVDLFSGRGGVGQAIAGGTAPMDPWDFAGVDIEDYSDTYPGRFAQLDLLDPIPTCKELGEALDAPTGGYLGLHAAFDDECDPPTGAGVNANVVWVSFPCTAYSSLSPTHYGSREAALEANPRITDALRERLLEIAPHYVIENVPGATRAGDLRANVRVNGLAFAGPDAPADEKFDLTRHFETTFPCPDAYRDPEPDEEYITIGTREDDDQSVQALADAKGVPAEWGKQGVRSAIPRQYVEWVLHFCPSIPSPHPKRVTRVLNCLQDSPLGVHMEYPKGGRKA